MFALIEKCPIATPKDFNESGYTWHRAIKFPVSAFYSFAAASTSSLSISSLTSMDQLGSSLGISKAMDS
jgi:hypothetical protein